MSARRVATYPFIDHAGVARTLRAGDRLTRDPGHGRPDRGRVTLIEGGYAWVQWESGSEVAHGPGRLDGARLQENP